jgi:hypothetical protein
MKFADTLIFSFAILSLLIGIHQTMTFGFAASYWLFMVTFGLLLWYQTRKKNQKKSKENNSKQPGDSSHFDKQKKRKYKM